MTDKIGKHIDNDMENLLSDRDKKKKPAASTYGGGTYYSRGSSGYHRDDDVDYSSYHNANYGTSYASPAKSGPDLISDTLYECLDGSRVVLTDAQLNAMTDVIMKEVGITLDSCDIVWSTNANRIMRSVMKDALSQSYYKMYGGFTGGRAVMTNYPITVERQAVQAYDPDTGEVLDE